MKIWWLVLIVIGVLVFGLWFVRLVLPSQVDDVSPGAYCSEKVLDWSDVYFIIPKFGNVSINKSWCDGILSRDKELAMHGVYHTYEEFGVFRDEEYFKEGVRVFEECFGFRTERFKPPQLAWSGENDWIKDEVNVDLIWNQVFHKVYHCGDSGRFPNWFVRVF